MRGFHVLLTGIYLNLELSLLGGRYYYPALHKRMMGRGKSLAQSLIADRIPAPTGLRRQNIHIYSTVKEKFQPKGVTQIVAQDPSTRRAEEDAHTACLLHNSGN